MALLELGVLHVKCGSSCKMLHTFVTMLVPPVDFRTPVIGGEGRMHLTVLGPQSCCRKSHHLLGHLRFQGGGYETRPLSDLTRES